MVKAKALPISAGSGVPDRPATLSKLLRGIKPVTSCVKGLKGRKADHSRGFRCGIFSSDHIECAHFFCTTNPIFEREKHERSSTCNHYRRRGPNRLCTAISRGVRRHAGKRSAGYIAAAGDHPGARRGQGCGHGARRLCLPTAAGCDLHR
jgi:hypothetical protein